MFEEVKGDIKYRVKHLSFTKGPLERRLSVTFLFTGWLLSSLGFITTIAVGDPFWVTIPNLFVGLMCIMIPLLWDDILKPTKVALYIVAFLFFPYLFFTMGGTAGVGFIYFIMITIYFAFYLKRKELAITNTLLLALYISIILHSYFNPNKFFPELDPSTHLVNIIVGIVSVSIVISIIASSTFREYSKEREIIKSLNKELEDQNEMLKDLSIRDSLTGVYNRRYFMQILETEITHFKTYKQNFNIMMIDLDDFKDINDNFGHLFGDEVLRKVAQQIQKSVRDYDIVARYGGEEFVVIVSHLNPEDSVSIAERIRLRVENIVLRDEAKMTVSIGVTEYKETDLSESVVKRADDFMYLAKQQGKNCVINKE